jgi:hypothetical protein
VVKPRGSKAALRECFKCRSATLSFLLKNVMDGVDKGKRDCELRLKNMTK